MASSRDGVRTYRVSSIRRLEVLEASFPRPVRFHLGSHWPSSVADFEARLLRESATVRLSPEGCQILRAVSPVAAARAEATGRAWGSGGWIEAEIPIESPTYAARQLLRLGTEVVVLAPRELRAAVRREARRVAELYSRGERDRRR